MSPKPECVLLVDDDEFKSALIAEMLSDQGVSRVMTAADGNKGLTALQGARHPPGIIICGINMPSTNGFQMLEMPAHRYLQSILCMYFIGGSK